MSTRRTPLPSPDAIAEWLPRQRWFGAKTRRIRHVTFADAVPLGAGVVLLADVELDGGGHERYALPLARVKTSSMRSRTSSSPGTSSPFWRGQAPSPASGERSAGCRRRASSSAGLKARPLI